MKNFTQIEASICNPLFLARLIGNNIDGSFSERDGYDQDDVIGSDHATRTIYKSSTGAPCVLVDYEVEAPEIGGAKFLVYGFNNPWLECLGLFECVEKDRKALGLGYKESVAYVAIFDPKVCDKMKELSPMSWDLIIWACPYTKVWDLPFPEFAKHETSVSDTTYRLW